MTNKIYTVMNHNIIKAQISDLETIVNMHIKYIGDSFFTYLGKKFLRAIYSELILWYGENTDQRGISNC